MGKVVLYEGKFAASRHFFRGCDKIFLKRVWSKMRLAYTFKLRFAFFAAFLLIIGEKGFLCERAEAEGWETAFSNRNAV